MRFPLWCEGLIFVLVAMLARSFFAELVNRFLQLGRIRGPAFRSARFLGCETGHVFDSGSDSWALCRSRGGVAISSICSRGGAMWYIRGARGARYRAFSDFQCVQGS